MSAVSSVNGNGQALYQFLQGVQANSQAQATAPTAGAGASQSSGQVQGAHHHHHHGGQGGESSKIASAVTDALQSAQASGNTYDPNKLIEGAIAKVFQDKGATPSSATGGQKASGSDPDGDGDIHSAGKAGDGNPAQQAFFQTLQSFGVDPQQFHADFLSAVKDAQGGQVDPSTVLKNLPPGSQVDTFA
jgi:hypothetical protein